MYPLHNTYICKINFFKKLCALSGANVKHRDMIFVRLRAPWYMAGGKHIYRTNWDL